MGAHSLHVVSAPPTTATLAVRVQKVAEAFRESDEEAARYELRALAEEARLLSVVTPLPICGGDSATVARRQKIRVEGRGLGAIG
jgi:hypothetical protein